MNKAQLEAAICELESRHITLKPLSALAIAMAVIGDVSQPEQIIDLVELEMKRAYLRGLNDGADLINKIFKEAKES